MKKRSFHPLGETEMELLQHVWALKRANVAQVHERVLQTRKIAYTTVMTVLKKLADKGYLQYEKQGNAYIYSPAEAPDAVRSSLLSNLIDKVFNGSPVALMQTLVHREALSEEEHEAIQDLLDAMRRQNENTPEGGDA